MLPPPPAGSLNTTPTSLPPAAIRREMTDTIRFLCKNSTAELMLAVSVEELAPGSDMRCVSVSGGVEAIEGAVDRVVEAEGGGRSIVFCRMMIVKNLVGLFMGRKGQNVDKIRRDTGARIKVLPLDAFLDAPAGSADEVIQVSGDPLAVKKAVIVISIFHWVNPSSRTEQVAGSSINSNVVPYPKSYTGSHDRETKKDPREVSYMLLCLKHNVGGVIGRGGTIINALEKETCTKIRFGSVVAQSEERVITISSFENHEAGVSPAQNAVVRVFTRIIEALMERRVGLDRERPVTARLLVPSSQMDCLTIDGSAKISEIRRVTSTNISLISGIQVPKCASENDVVVQVSGKLQNVQDALFQITSKLRETIFSTKLPKSSAAEPQSYHSPSLPFFKGVENFSSDDNPTSLAYDLNNIHLHSNGHPSSSHRGHKKVVGSDMPMSRYERGQGPFRQIPDFERGTKAVVTNTTVEIAVPGDCISLIYGNNGTNLSSMRQISGAKVIVNSPHPGSTQAMVTISGTPDQTLAAQSILQAYILGGKS